MDYLYHRKVNKSTKNLNIIIRENNFRRLRKSMGKKEYFLGLDLGTSSVGWAVTDNQYQLMRAKGKDLWGVRLFEEAETAAGRRTNRVARRRRQRETARIGLLKEYFADAIAEIDGSFFERLEESKYHFEDKKIQEKYSIFADKNYTDKDYYEEYPTVYHLRMELIHNMEAHDVRLVYLALLNMFKHRGHFLNSGLKAEEQNSGIQESYLSLLMITNEQYGLELPEIIDYVRLEEILSRKDISRSKMTEEVAGLFNITKSKNKREYEVVKGICGLFVSVTVLLDVKELDENHKKVQFSFRDAGYDEKIADISQLLEEQDMELIDTMKQLHDIGLLASVMKGSKYLSEARMKDYEKHKRDLNLLKKVILEYVPEKYDEMFREMQPGSYSAYVNSVNADKKQRRNVKGRKQEDLYKKIKTILKDVEDCEAKEYILSEIESESFLPKQLTASNGIIPNQVHAIEMKKILKNAEGYLPFLKEKDDSGLTVSERILELFQFQIPYYVGPLNLQHADKKEGHAWAIRKKQGKVLPWNINEMIDMKQTSEEFISNMVRHCTYLNGERAIPKDSLLYQRFCVLNELNNLKIRGEKPSVELKQHIYEDLFMKGKKVTQKQLYNYLIGCGILELGEADAVSGIDKDFKNSLSSYGKFASVFGADIKLDSTKDMVEQIIFWGTVYGNDKTFLRERIKECYNDRITEEQLKRITGFKFHDWGKLSRKFLELSGCDKSTGEVLPLISMMWESNCNLMELLSDKYTYAEELRKQSVDAEKVLSEMQYEDLDELYLSKPVKRMVWQTILILQELEGVLGGCPSRIFVEMPREDGEKGKRTDSRRQKLAELYKGCKIDGRNWVKELDRWSDQELRSKKLYLYYLQQGRCMYTGEPIDLADLFNDNLYDIDHIYPRHFVKDDSIENNLVLVKKEKNAHKSDNYPIEDSIYKARRAWWRSLLTDDMQSKFITREKYNRLVNREPFSDDQLAGFISRQIVETRQGTKAMAHLFENMFPDSEVVYVKAGNVSSFRQDRKLLKCRSVNDFHHAQDAYLNIVVGNTYFVKFTKNPRNFIEEYHKNPEKNKYHLCKIFNSTVVRNGEIAWLAGEKNGNPGTIATVCKMMAKNSPLITRMNFEAHGQISEATLYGAKTAKPESYIPLKSSDNRLQDVTKYGGFGSVRVTYFFLVEHEKKGKRIRTLEAIPLYLRDKIGDNMELLNQYCEEELHLVKPDVRIARIKIQSLIRRNGYLMHISGKSNQQLIVRNAIPLCLNQYWVNYIKKLEKTVGTRYVDDNITDDKNKELYYILTEKHRSSIFAKRPNAIGDKLLSRQVKFENLDLLGQAEVLMQILQLTQLSNMGADLSLIGEAKKTGITLISKVVSDAEEFVLINQSPAGLYESEIDLKTI